MSLNELKPLTKEMIHEMGLHPHDLWLVKQGSEVMGPFEQETLCQFSESFQDTCEELLATRVENNDWQPFYEHAAFERKHPQKQKEVPVHYWLLVDGQKKGPHSLMDIQKKLEMEIISLSDVVSKDDGETWYKLFHDEAFAEHHPTELPMAPSEESFQRVKLDLVERLHDQEEEEKSLEENLAGMAYILKTQDKGPELKIDEITVKIVQTTEISRTLKWKVPAAAAAFMTLIVAGNYFISEPSSDAQMEEAAVATSEVILPKAKKVIANRRELPQALPVRDPASLKPHHDRSSLTMPNYEAYSTHQEAPEEIYPEDNYDQQQQPNQPQEHSLLGGPQAPVDDYGHTDGNQPASAEQPARDLASEMPPAVEEVGDF